MRTWIRGLLSSVAAVTVALAIASGTVAQAQSPSPSPASSPTPDRFCGLLTTDEITEALGVAVTVAHGSELDCNWQSAGVLGSFQAGVRSGSIADIKATVPGGLDLTVGEAAAYYLTDSLWLEVSGRLLELHLFMSDIADPQAALMALATIAVARVDSLAIPDVTAPSPSPQPSPLGDIELRDLFPASLRGFDGVPLDVMVISGAEALKLSDAHARRILRTLLAALEVQGRTVNDVSIAFATVSDGTTWAILYALRVKDADPDALLPVAIPFFAPFFLDQQGNFGKARRASAQVAGKDVTVLTPAKKALLTGYSYGYVYGHDDVVWMVAVEWLVGGHKKGPADAISRMVLEQLP